MTDTVPWKPWQHCTRGVASCCGSAWPRLVYSGMNCNVSCCIVVELCHLLCTCPLPLSCSLRAGPGLHSAGSSSQCMAVAHDLLLSGFAPVHRQQHCLWPPLPPHRLPDSGVLVWLLSTHAVIFVSHNWMPARLTNSGQAKNPEANKASVSSQKITTLSLTGVLGQEGG